MRGIDLIVLSYLQENPRSSSCRIAKDTDLTVPSVKSALRILLASEHVDFVFEDGGHYAKLYSAKSCAGPEIFCETDVCGRHFTLTGAQIRELRDKAKEYSDVNRRNKYIGP